MTLRNRPGLPVTQFESVQLMQSGFGHRVPTLLLTEPLLAGEKVFPQPL